MTFTCIINLSIKIQPLVYNFLLNRQAPQSALGIAYLPSTKNYNKRNYQIATHAIMNVNKKLDRFKQWAGERMGGEVKTSVSDDFKSLEVEMGLRHEGRMMGSKQSLHMLILPRHGASAEVHDHLCQDSFQT